MCATWQILALKSSTRLIIKSNVPKRFSACPFDPTGLTENMVILETYANVFVKTVPGVTIKRTASGFMIIVK